MKVQIEHVDAQQLLDEEERDRRADEEALRSGRKTHAQLKRENEIFAFPPERMRVNLDSARCSSDRRSGIAVPMRRRCGLDERRTRSSSAKTRSSRSRPSACGSIWIRLVACPERRVLDPRRG